MSELRTERLLLRPWRSAGLAPFAALNADPVVMEHFPAPLTRAESDGMVERIAAHFVTYGYGLWAVEVPRTASFVGFVGLNHPGFIPGVEIGWRLAPTYWHRGYATEAAEAALAQGFAHGLEEIVAFTAAVNARSMAVMERLGMRRDAGADFDHPSLPGGHRLRRHMLYRLSRGDWQARWDHRAGPPLG